MAWTKVNHSGNREYIECASCEHEFAKGEVCYKKSWPLRPEKFMGFEIQNFLTEVTCQRCFDKRGLKVGKDKTKPNKRKKKR